MENSNHTDKYIRQYIKVAEQLKEGNYTPDIPIATFGELKQLGVALQELARMLEMHYRELLKFDQITSQINAGLLLDDILEQVYRDFRDIIPYNRIGFSFIESDGKIVRARWAKTDQPSMFLKRNYAALLEGSSLQTIIDTRQPRIINDLAEYFKAKPDSKSTCMIIAEGIRSSLTCPLIVNDIPVGFMFFSSIYPDTYNNIHVEVFQKIAAQLSVIVEKGRLVSDLTNQKDAIERQHEELRHLHMLQEEYVQQAARVTRAAAEVEEGKFIPESLDEVAGRTDALGQLARVFQNMAREVYAREQLLKHQIQELRIEIDQSSRKEEFDELVGTEFYAKLKEQAKALRKKRSEQ